LLLIRNTIEEKDRKDRRDMSATHIRDDPIRDFRSRYRKIDEEARQRSESICCNIDVGSIRPNGLGLSLHEWPNSLLPTGSPKWELSPIKNYRVHHCNSAWRLCACERAR